MLKGVPSSAAEVLFSDVDYSTQEYKTCEIDYINNTDNVDTIINAPWFVVVWNRITNVELFENHLHEYENKYGKEKLYTDINLMRKCLDEAAITKHPKARIYE